MKYDYEYDDSGLASSYLVLSILLPLTLYLTYRRLRTEPSIKRYPCSCIYCMKTPHKSSRGISVFLLAFLWTMVSFMAKNILTLKLEYRSEYFNPYRLLEIDENAPIADIKKAFRRKVAKLNPDTADEDEKEEVTNKLKEIIKAFNFLKENRGRSLASETTYEVVAIPRWIVEKGYAVLILYGIIVGLCFPRWAFRKWNSHIRKNQHDVYYSTMDRFYRWVEGDQKEIRSIIAFITSSKDFRKRWWRSRGLGSLKQHIEENFGYPLKDTGRGDTGYLVLMDHLFRTGRADAKDLEFVQTKSIAMINSMKAVAVQRNMRTLLETLFVLERMIVQAVFDPDFHLMQHPECSFESVFLKNKKVRDSMSSGDALPAVKIRDVEAFVEKTELVETGSRKVDSTTYEVPCESRVTISFLLERDKQTEFVHAPFLKREIRLLWTIFVTVDDQVLDETTSVFNSEDRDTFTFVFDGAEERQQSTVIVHVKSGEYFGVDCESSIVLRYVK
eukprot:jgi/Antlo1/445/1775